MTVEYVLNQAWDRDVRGTSPSFAKKVLRGERRLSVDLIEAVARALGVAPREFAEWRLAEARRQIDERQMGLDRAVTTLENWVGPCP